MSRAFLATVTAIVAAAAAAAAAAAPVGGAAPVAARDFVAGLQRPFTLAGGGRLPAVTGAVASRVGIRPVAIAALPDGGTIVALARRPRPGASNLVLLNADGRVEALPFGPALAGALDVERSGNVVATAVGSTQIFRIFPAERRVEVIAGKTRPAAGLPASARKGALNAIAALEDGTIVVTDEQTAYRVSPEGRFTDSSPGEDGDPVGVAALADGAFAVLLRQTNELVRVAADGKPVTLLKYDDEEGPALASAPDGGVLLLDGAGLRHVGGDGRVQTIFARGSAGPVPAFGTGDGAPIAGARFVPATTYAGTAALAVAPDGAVLFATNETLRVIVGASTTRRLVALDQTGYMTLRDGRAKVLTTLAGSVRLTVTGTGTPIVSAPVALPAGGGEVTLPRTPSGVVRVELSLTDAAGARTVSRAAVDTRRTLPRRDAYEAIDSALQGRGEGDDGASSTNERGPCRRKAALRIDCRVLDVYTIYDPGLPPNRSSAECDGRIVARLRPDGIVLAEDDSCRPL